jgi:hypothetical protein
MRRRSSLAGGFGASGRDVLQALRRRSSVLKGRLAGAAPRVQVQPLPAVATAATREAAYYAQVNLE